jgi:hypothetical protein
MPLQSCPGDGYVDAAPVLVAQAALNQAMVGQPVDQPGQRTLAEMDDTSQFLGAELVRGVLGESLQDLELTDSEAVTTGSASPAGAIRPTRCVTLTPAS